MARYLVVAHQTAESGELLDALKATLRMDPAATFTLLVPATPVNHLLAWEEGETEAIAQRRAEATVETWRRQGLDVTDSRIGDMNPVLAIEDELRHDPLYDRIILSTFPTGVSRWLTSDLITRVRSRTGLEVTHVVAERIPAPQI